ncbi:MAG: MBL fold metallo-hydrolase [Pirellulaceae bacterium]
MEVITLQSGSSGNCIYVESDGIRLLFDAGISGRQAEMRLRQYGKEIRDVDALIISHDHSDHTQCMGPIHRKFGIPIYCTQSTFHSVDRRNKLGRVNDVRFFDVADDIRIEHLTIATIETPHDSHDSVIFIVDNTRRRLGIMTDLGHVFDGLASAIQTLDAVILESNYDVEMLKFGPYPPHLKKRIAGPGGHISNAESAQLLRNADPARLQWACLAHLSEENNDPDVALQTHRELLGDRFELSCADRRMASPVMRIDDPCEPLVENVRQSSNALF